jgi:hypothetical protein
MIVMMHQMTNDVMQVNLPVADLRETLQFTRCTSRDKALKQSADKTIERNISAQEFAKRSPRCGGSIWCLHIKGDTF